MRLAATVGFLAGTLPPLVRGIGMIVDDMYVRGPHSCGLEQFAGWMHILCIAPIGGVVGAAIGCGCSALYRASRRTGGLRLR
jgi:hypothetical protein